MYEDLKKVYYKNQHNHEIIYKQRFNGENSIKLPLYIKAWKGSTHQLFYVNTAQITNLLVRIYEMIIKNKEISLAFSDGEESPFMHYYRKEMLIEEILSTNNIEGIRSTRKDLAEAEKEVSEHNKKPRFYYVLNKYKKLQEKEDIQLVSSADLRTVYDEFISAEVHKDNDLDGVIFRKDGVNVLDSRGTGMPIHHGIDNEESIINHVNMLFSYMNDNNDSADLIKIAVFQYFFGYIHPFYDGNGRVSRYLISNYLKNLDSLLSFKVSKVIFDNIQTYYSLFDQTNQELNKGDMTPFVTGFLQLLLYGVEEINDELSKYNLLFKNFSEFVSIDDRCLKLDTYTKKVFFIIYQATIYDNELSLASLQRNTNSSYGKVRKHVDILIELDLVKRMSHKDYAVKEDIFQIINSSK